LQLTIQPQEKRKIENMTTLHLKTSIQRWPLRRGFLLIAFALVLAWLGLSPAAQALLPPPPPDGGYRGENTAEGTNALINVIPAIGTDNTASGFEALFTNTTGRWNTANGARALNHNNGDLNTATGNNALRDNQTGTRNTAAGAGALRMNTTGNFNTADGFHALLSNQVGSNNTATGVNALFSNTGSINGATFGSFNTANGVNALFTNTTGFRNTAIGVSALSSNLDANENTALGADALMSNQFQGGNTAVGVRALSAQTQFGANNTAIGVDALKNNGLPPFGQAPNANTAVGVGALFNNQSGLLNTALGVQAGFNVTTARNVICIAHIGQNVSFSTWIDNIYGVTTQSGITAPVIVSNTGQLGTVASSERFKKDITAMEKASEAILSLRPVTFHYKTDTTGTPQFGLIAEEVAKVNPALVLPDKEGKPYSVRYDQVNAMLLNEFLKEHRKVEELKATVAKQEETVAQQQKRMEAVIARLEEQAAQIQKVSAHLEVNKTAPQIVLNNQ
jgi:Chaperone of endosialidase